MPFHNAPKIDMFGDLTSILSSCCKNRNERNEIKTNNITTTLPKYQPTPRISEPPTRAPLRTDYSTKNIEALRKLPTFSSDPEVLYQNKSYNLPDKSQQSSPTPIMEYYPTPLGLSNVGDDYVPIDGTRFIPFSGPLSKNVLHQYISPQEDQNSLDTSSNGTELTSSNLPNIPPSQNSLDTSSNGAELTSSNLPNIPPYQTFEHVQYGDSRYSLLSSQDYSQNTLEEPIYLSNREVKRIIASPSDDKSSVSLSRKETIYHTIPKSQISGPKLRSDIVFLKR